MHCAGAEAGGAVGRGGRPWLCSPAAGTRGCRACAFPSLGSGALSHCGREPEPRPAAPCRAVLSRRRSGAAPGSAEPPPRLVSSRGRAFGAFGGSLSVAKGASLASEPLDLGSPSGRPTPCEGWRPPGLLGLPAARPPCGSVGAQRCQV